MLLILSTETKFTYRQYGLTQYMKRESGMFTKITSDYQEGPREAKYVQDTHVFINRGQQSIITSST